MPRFAGIPIEKTMASASPAGLVAAGNIDLSKRPIAHNPDGSYSTVRSISVDQDGHSYLIPTVVGGKVVSNDQAIQHFNQTGENLGQFDNWQNADKYAETLHNEQAAAYDKKASATSGGRFGGVPVDSLPTATVSAPAVPDERSSLSDFMGGLGRGAWGTAQGAGQLIMHSPAAKLGELIRGKIKDAGITNFGEGTPLGDTLANMPGSLDDQIRSDTAAFDNGAGSSLSGKVGNIAGSMLATAPLAALSVPVKGASLMSAIGRGALAGGAGAATQPVVGGDYATEKAKQTALGAALGGAIPAAGRGIMSAAESVLPANLVQRTANFFTRQANAKPFAAESEALAARTGIPFTPGQVSGAKMQTGMENLSRQSFFSADKAFEADTKTADAAIDYINRTMNKLSTSKDVTAEGVGGKVQDIVRNAVKSVADSREKVARQQYGALDKMLGDTPVVRYNKTTETLAGMLDEYADVPGPAAAAMRSQLQGMLDDIAKKPAYTLSSAQKARSAYGRAASGSADIFKDVKTGEQARMAKRLYGAMTDDIETSAAALDGGARSGPGLMTQADNALMERGGVADLWRKANEDYRNHSKLIESMEASPLRRLVGDKVDVGDFMTVNKLPPEKVIDALGGMKPTELKYVGALMQKQAPDVWQDYKRLLVENALNEAQAAPASMGANTLPINAAKFVSALGGGKPAKIEQLKALFTPKEYAQIDDAFNAMRRLGDKFGANFSGTAAATEMTNMLKGFGVKTAASVGSQVVGLRKIANVMLNSDGRRAVVQLSRLPPQSRQAASLVGYITSLANAGPDSEKQKDQDSEPAPGNDGGP